MILQHRRVFLFSLSALGGWPAGVFASPSGTDDRSGRDDAAKNGVPGTRRADGKLEIKQKDLTDLTDKQIRWLQQANVQGAGVVIPGFGPGMKVQILSGLQFRRRSMQRLIRRMLGIKGVGKRRAALQREIKKVEGFIAKIQQNVNRLTAKANAGTITELEQKVLNSENVTVFRLSRYPEVLRQWVKTPLEGSP